MGWRIKAYNPFTFIPRSAGTNPKLLSRLSFAPTCVINPQNKRTVPRRGINGSPPLLTSKGRKLPQKAIIQSKGFIEMASVGFLNNKSNTTKLSDKINNIK